MIKKYVTCFTHSLMPHITEVEIVRSSPRCIITCNSRCVLGSYHPPSRMSLAQYRVFDSLEEAKIYLVEITEKKMEKLKSDLAYLG